MKTIIGILIGIVITFSMTTYANTYVAKTMPDYISKFVDGKVTCYVMRDSDYKFTNGGSTYGVSYSGISCIK